MVEFLIDNGADIGYVGPVSDNSALQLAVVHGHVEVVKHLVKKGANINLRDKLGNSLLIYARFGSIEMLKTLIHYQIDINKPNFSGETILTLLSGNPFHIEDLPVWKFLIDKGGDILHKNSAGMTPLIGGARAGNASA